MLSRELTGRSPPGSCERLLRGRQLVYTERVELGDGWATRVSPIWSITGIPIDVVAAVPIGWVEACKIQSRKLLRLGAHGSIHEVDPPLTSSPTAEARVEKVLMEQNQVAGFGHHDVRGQGRGGRTIDSKTAKCVPKIRVVRTRQDPEGAVLGS